MRGPQGVEVQVYRREPYARRPVEVVERKGLGHPDTMCDALAEQVAGALAGAYLATTGRIQHFNADKCLLVANDTSVATGYAPLSEAERLVLGLERFLNGPDFKRAFPETGRDVKVMGYRVGPELALTVAMPLLAACVASEADCQERRKASTFRRAA